MRRAVIDRRTRETQIRVRIGIEAPSHVAVVRAELMDDDEVSARGPMRLAS